MFDIVRTRCGEKTSNKPEPRRWVMPLNGDTNTKFGFYQNLCCGKEIVVPEGSRFPLCPNHSDLPTIWRPIIEHKPANSAKASGATAVTPLFRVGDEIRILGPGPQKGNSGVVVEVITGPLGHVHRYLVRSDDGSIFKYFGFELEFIEQGWSRVA
jgi:hypothetical protein